MPEAVSSRGIRRTFAFDARGHGESDRAPTYRFLDFGNDAVAFLGTVVREPAVVIGHSLGAMTAIYAAANSPQLTLGAVLLEPPLYLPEAGLRDSKEMFTSVRNSAGKSQEELLQSGVAD